MKIELDLKLADLMQDERAIFADKISEKWDGTGPRFYEALTSYGVLSLDRATGRLVKEIYLPTDDDERLAWIRGWETALEACSLMCVQVGNEAEMEDSYVWQGCMSVKDAIDKQLLQLRKKD
jgi:hypothetical protein